MACSLSPATLAVKYRLWVHPAQREVLERQLEASRLGRVLERLSHGTIRLVDTVRFTPLAFPLVVDSTRARVSSEKLSDRIRRMSQLAEGGAFRGKATHSRSRAEQIFTMTPR